MSAAERQGFDAYRNGFARTTNPHERHSDQWYVWDAGWHYAHTNDGSRL